MVSKSQVLLCRRASFHFPLGKYENLTILIIVFRHNSKKWHFGGYPTTHLRISCHVSQVGKVCTRRQEDPFNCLAYFGKWWRRISRFTAIGGQVNWWRLVKLKGNYYMWYSYLISPYPLSPYRSVIAHLLTIALPSNFTHPTHMARGP